jgi:hypothetical protein
MTVRSVTQAPRWLSALMLVFCLASALLWLVPLISSHHVLFPSGPAFEDIIVYRGRFSVYHSLKFFTSRAYSAFAYPPGAAPVYAAFYRTHDAIATYLTLAAAATIAAVATAWILLRRTSAAGLFPLLIFFSFPLVFLIQRANIEIVLWLLIACGLLAHRRNLGVIAAILFGLAAAIKLYPILLLGLFLNRRESLRAFFAGLGTAIVGLIAACAYTGPTLFAAARGFTLGVDHFQDHYVDKVSSTEVLFDHSLFSPLKYHAYTHHNSPAGWTMLYYLLAGTFALLLFLRVRTMPPLNRVIFLTVAMVSLPPVSFTYTLTHLYLPIILLIAGYSASRTMPLVTALATLALLLFLMLPIVSLNVIRPTPSGPLQSCALFAVLVLSAIAPWSGKVGLRSL